jgi:hypothetical protein
MLFEVSKWGVETDSTVFCARICDPSADVNETDRLNEAVERNQNLTLYVAPSQMSCRKQTNRKKIQNSETLYVCDRQHRMTDKWKGKWFKEQLTIPQNPGFETPTPLWGHWLLLLLSSASHKIATLNATGFLTKGEERSVPRRTCVSVPTANHGRMSEGVFRPPASNPKILPPWECLEEVTNFQHITQNICMSVHNTREKLQCLAAW